MKHLFTALTLLIGFTSLSQTLSDARKLFNNYEYEQAATIFQEEYDANGLEEEDLKHLVYSHYVNGNFEACQPVCEELINNAKKIEPMFYLISGDANRGVGNYSKAVKAYEIYKENDGEENVDIKIASCREIVNWDDEEFVAFNEFNSNGKMADLSGGIYNGELIRFKEIGYDKMQEMMGVVGDDNSSFAELLLTQPSILINGKYRNIFMQDSSMASVSSIAFLPESTKALLTISYPLSKDPLERAPNLYWAELTSSNSFENVTPFEFSGIKDTSSTAHATISPNGDQIIFTKAGSRTKGSDLYTTSLKNGVWMEPKPLKSLNSEGHEMFPMYQGDSMLTFSSSGRIGYGGLDIYKVKLPIEDSEIDHFKAPINSLKDDFNLTYVKKDSAIFVSNRADGTGDDDLYYITFEREEIIEDTFNTNEFIANWKTKNVYFDFDKFELNKSLSNKNIESINELFENCESCKIRLTAYTDSRGSSSYNLKLSQKRANSVKSMLIKEGFTDQNIVTEAKGETDQPYDCGEDCSDEQHKLNRVVEIDVIKN
tara:strand:- start:27560 stop:29188 length:1629 start_codon:yes stop_codon:yes gene_type:complete